MFIIQSKAKYSILVDLAAINYDYIDYQSHLATCVPQDPTHTHTHTHSEQFGY